MGLYLCIFDEMGDELEGLEVGSYADFSFFRDAVTAVIERGNAGAVCPTLQNHSDCDGEWTSDESKTLIAELDLILDGFWQCPPVELNSEWKKEVIKTFGLDQKTLLDCFFDIDGEPLVEKLKRLAQVSIETGQPILFQ